MNAKAKKENAKAKENTKAMPNFKAKVKAKSFRVKGSGSGPPDAPGNGSDDGHSGNTDNDSS